MRTSTTLSWSCDACGDSGTQNIPLEDDPTEVAFTACPTCSEPLSPFNLIWVEE